MKNLIFIHNLYVSAIKVGFGLVRMHQVLNVKRYKISKRNNVGQIRWPKLFQRLMGQRMFAKSLTVYTISCRSTNRFEPILQYYCSRTFCTRVDYVCLIQWMHSVGKKKQSGVAQKFPILIIRCYGWRLFQKLIKTSCYINESCMTFFYQSFITNQIHILTQILKMTFFNALNMLLTDIIEMWSYGKCGNISCQHITLVVVIQQGCAIYSNFNFSGIACNATDFFNENWKQTETWMLRFCWKPFDGETDTLQLR